MKTNKTSSLALGTLLLAGAVSASAAPRVFQWSSAELSSLDGIVSTHQRIQNAARSYCQDRLHGTRGVWQMRTCVSAVTDEIVTSVGDARLTAYVRDGVVADDQLARR